MGKTGSCQRFPHHKHREREREDTCRHIFPFFFSFLLETPPLCILQNCSLQRNLAIGQERMLPCFTADPSVEKLGGKVALFAPRRASACARRRGHAFWSLHRGASRKNTPGDRACACVCLTTVDMTHAHGCDTRHQMAGWR